MGEAGGGAAAERWLLMAFSVIRAAAAVMLTIMAASGERHWLMAVALAESAVLVAWAWRSGRVPRSRVVFADGAFLGAVMLAVLVTTARDGAWDNWPFDYGVSFSLGLGLAGGRWRVSLPALAPVLAVVAAASPVTGHPIGFAAFDLATLTVNTAVGTLVAGAVRRRGAEADAAREAAVTAEAEAAVERERAAHARVIHDQVLQTLELLSQDGRVADADLRGSVRAEAGRLRELIATGPARAAEARQGAGGTAGVSGTGVAGVSGAEGLRRAVDRARGLGVNVDLTVEPTVTGAGAEKAAAAVESYLAGLAGRRGRVVIYAEEEPGCLILTITHPGPPAAGPYPEGAEVLFTAGEGTEFELRVAVP
ncbi:hypothetical protein [Streptosporangium sp. NPDC000396]|uniref:hypothetical protein n=1 Tax=Streptosporangium sp. NPDC000396 TaxID=3366185 RepID=UPI00367E54D1